MKTVLKNLWNWLVSSLPRKSLAVPEHRRRAESRMKKSIWVFYESEYGIDPDRDRTIRKFFGESEWYGSGIATNGERDSSFYWSEAIEARAIHLKNTGLIDRIQIFEPVKQTA